MLVEGVLSRSLIRTQQFEEVLENGHGIVVLDQAEQESCMNNVIATNELFGEFFLEV